ncbi:PocR ligand-binding domain-containing protein [Candidatus Omnitrophota bacterium]
MLDSHFPFESLIDVQKWQKIQDNFSLVTDVSLRLIDPSGNLITKPSREPRLCSDLLLDSPFNKNICNTCLPTFLGGTGRLDKNHKSMQAGCLLALKTRPAYFCGSSGIEK